MQSLKTKLTNDKVIKIKPQNTARSVTCSIMFLSANRNNQTRTVLPRYSHSLFTSTCTKLTNDTVLLSRHRPKLCGWLSIIFSRFPGSTHLSSRAKCTLASKQYEYLHTTNGTVPAKSSSENWLRLNGTFKTN